MHAGVIRDLSWRVGACCECTACHMLDLELQQHHVKAMPTTTMMKTAS